ncbi:MAG: peptidylprolyl isomerase [Cyclobacteriaceae bacterium]|nr:peptidylprolyl isomerase [Cyclobacteriaceae bacterium HetDA_MAG_MS6]
MGQAEISQEEFKEAFLKNYSKSENSIKDDVSEYLSLYINFKRKVVEAEALGYDTTQVFQKDIEGYIEDLVKSERIEHKILTDLIKETYERSLEEVSASHILVLTEKTKPEDTVQAYQKIKSYQKRLEAGEDFAELAQEVSEDPSAKNNAGNLGYFSSLQMVYPFENAAFSLPIGAVSDPVKTDFGYHLIKVQDRRKNRGKFKLAHIMLTETGAMQKSDSLADLLHGGASWAELCQEFSDDPYSKASGGELPWLGSGEIFPEFITAADQLEKGAFTKISSPYGWHLLKLVDRKPMPTYEEMETSLKDRITRDARYKTSKIEALTKFKKKHGVEDLKGDEFSDFEKQLILKENPNMQSLMEEYRQGTLLFNIMTDKVWSVSEDEENLKAFFDTQNEVYDKPLEDIKGKVMSDYQAQLEQQWLSELEAKYPVNIPNKSIKKIAKEIERSI